MIELYDEMYCDTESEFQELRAFLLDCYTMTGRAENWLFGRLEDWKYGANAQLAEQNPNFFADHVHVWRDAAGALVGFCIAEHGDNSFYLQVHPQRRWVEDVMLAWAELNWAGAHPSIATYAYTHDTARRRLLARRGYANIGESGRTYMYDLGRQYPARALPAGFRIATLAEDHNVNSHIAAVRGAFGRDTLNRAWFATKAAAPTYDPTWDLAVVAPDGEHAAFCLARLDRHSQVAEIDPIGTRPDYQRRGLAHALVAECFRRLRACGMRYAYIGSGPEPAVGNRLYVALQPSTVAQEHQWAKQLTVSPNHYLEKLQVGEY